MGLTILRVLVFVLIVAAGGVAQPSEAVEGDPQAWQDVKTSYERLASAKSYRLNRGPGYTVEVVNPGRFHEILRGGGTTLETIIVGDEIRARVPGFPWRCVSPDQEGFPLLRLHSTERFRSRRDPPVPQMLLLLGAFRDTAREIRISRLGTIAMGGQEGLIMSSPAVDIRGRPECGESGRDV